MSILQQRRRAIRRFAPFMFLLACPSLFGQQSLSTIRGTAADSSGAVVPGVTITAREVLTNVLARTVTTDDQGNFEMPALKSGTYKVTASMTGFKTSVVEDVALQSNLVKRVDVILEIGEVATEVTVSAASAVIQTEQGKIGSDFEAAKQYASFPTPGNAFSGTYAILAVLPDVQRAPGDWGEPTLAGQGGNQVHMGQDGVKEETLNSQTVNMEAVAELKAVAVNNTADYARPGYFDAITKSGTNQYHAEGSYYHRNSALGARNFFEDQKAKVIYHTFNLAGSGPIIKDKTFFYALWNGERVPGHSFHSQSVPTEKMRSGDFSQLLGLSSPVIINDPLTGQAFPGNKIPTNRLSGVGVKFQDRFFPLPNRGPDELTNNLGFIFQYPDDQFYADVFSIRVDHRLSDKNSMYGRIQAYLPQYVLASGYPTTTWTRTRQSHSWVFSDTHVFSPTVVHSFTFGGNRDGLKDNEQVNGYQPGSGAAIVQELGLQGVNQAGVNSPGGSPVVNISGYDEVAIRQGGNTSAINFNLADSLTWAKGRHVIKFGGELRTYNDFNGQVSNDNFGRFDFNGSFSGNAYADFLLGLPISSTRLDPLVDRKRTSKELGLFVTDTFKVSTKLTLDFGLRWDRFSSTTYDDGLMFNWDPATGNVIVPSEAASKVSPLYPNTIKVVTGDAVPKPDNKNFVPRIGFAYRLNEATVIRGGYGLFNEFQGRLARVNGTGPFQLSETYFNSIKNGVPLFQMPNPFPSSGVSAEVPSQSVTGFPTETKNGLIHQFNISAERQIKDIGIRLSYVGSRNRGMNYSIGTNLPQQSLTPFDDSRRPYQQFVGTTFYRTDGKTNYDSLSFEVNRRVGWFTFDAHWTWAHGMNDMLNLENPYGPLYWNRDFLAKHRVVFNTMWDLPFGKGKQYLAGLTGVPNHIIGGWRIAWVTYLQSGQFFSPSFSDADPSNTNSFGGLPDRVCNGNLPPGQRRIDGWFDPSCFVNPPAGRFGNSGANVLEGPGLHAHNVTLMKRFPFTERINFDLMWMISNVFNHTNFLSPAADISVPGGAGVIGETYGFFSGERAGPRMMEVRARISF